MSSRKRRSSARQQEEGSPGAEEDVREETPAEQQPRRKRRSVSTTANGAAAAAAAAAAGDDVGADDGDTGAAAAAAAAAAGGGRGRGRAGGNGSGGASRARQAVVSFNQEEADLMMQKVKALDDEAELAQDKAANLDLADASLQAAVSKVVRFLLFRHHEKPGLPVKRQDINDVITAAACVPKGGRVAKKLPAIVLPLAAAKLARAFGMELREMKKHTAGEAGAAAAGADGAAAAPAAAAATAAASASAGGQSYKLLSMLPGELLMQFGQALADNQERGFITVVLALLQLQQCKMEADELWGHLSQMGIERDSNDAVDLFGKHPSKILEGMEHSKYLVSSKKPAPNTEQGVQLVYEWGEAAHDEFGGGVLQGVVDQWLKTGEGGDD